jgi:hypothetical protein
LIDSLVRLICEGWLPQDPYSSPGLHSGVGRDPAFTESGLPTAPTRAPVDGDVTAFRLLAAPRQPPGAVDVLDGLVQGGGLPAERGELTRDRDRDRPGWLAALSGEVHPALVQSLLAAPGDLNDTGILT